MTTAHVENESPQQCLTVFRVGDLGMKLDAIYLEFGVLHRRNRIFAVRRSFESRWRLENDVAVTHPDPPYTLEQRRRFDGFDLPRSVLAAGGRPDLTTEFFGNELHTVTDTENGDARMK